MAMRMNNAGRDAALAVLEQQVDRLGAMLVLGLDAEAKESQVRELEQIILAVQVSAETLQLSQSQAHTQSLLALLATLRCDEAREGSNSGEGSVADRHSSWQADVEQRLEPLHRHLEEILAGQHRGVRVEADCLSEKDFVEPASGERQPVEPASGERQPVEPERDASKQVASDPDARVGCAEEREAMGPSKPAGLVSAQGSEAFVAAGPAAALSAPPGSGFGFADDLELLREFLVEASGHLESIESGTLALEDHPEDRETLNLLFRGFHSIKGLAGFLEIAAIQHTAHELESLLDLAREGRLRISREAIDLILDTHTYLTESLGMVAACVEGKSIAAIEEDAGLIERITRYQERAATVMPAASGGDDKKGFQGFREDLPVSSPAAEWREEGTATAGLAAPPDQEFQPAGAMETAPITESTPTGGTGRITHSALPAKPGFSAAPGISAGVSRASTVASVKPGGDGATERGASAARASAAGAVVKIDIEKLDYLVDMVGELVIAQSMVRHDPVLESHQSTRLAKNMAQMTRVTAEVQRMAMSMRMVPIKGLFQRMSRLARDLARKYGKQVHVELEGEETELDRTLIELLADPMMHMVRNAIDHGLEDAAQREAQGKSAEGTIRLSASHQSGSILISIEDNGRGLDRKRILEKAVSRGLVNEHATLTEAQIDQLIFEPGFSTAAVVSDLSGRGVGMDVVRRNIQQLRGRVEVHSESGKGTSMTMKLPLTLAIIDGLVVRAEGERFIIPLFSVREMFRVTEGAVTHVQGRQEVLQVRGGILPVVRLGQQLGISKAGKGMSDAVSRDGIASGGDLCLVVESARSVYCLLVDEFVGKQEVVIKSLGEQFAQIPGIAAGAILGDGAVGLILDMEGIFEGVCTR